jgi:hypothetical protein
MASTADSIASRLDVFFERLTVIKRRILRLRRWLITTIVNSSTLIRWIREEKLDAKEPPVKDGWRKKPEQIRRLILKLARENQ